MPQEQDLHRDIHEAFAERVQRERHSSPPTRIISHSQAEAAELLRSRVRAALGDEPMGSRLNEPRPSRPDRS
jgi:hypothetical protein